MDRPRALVQMATGSGKTFTTVNFVYRLIKHANPFVTRARPQSGPRGRFRILESSLHIRPSGSLATAFAGNGAGCGAATPLRETRRCRW